MRGPLLLLTALLLFAALDANSKLLSGGYGVGQVLAIRYAVLLGLLGAARLIRPGAGGGVATRRPRAQLLRAVLMLGSGAGFFLSLRHLPLAEGYLVYFTAPFMLLGLSRLILREAVPAAAWGWCGVGFLGVLLALSPSLFVTGLSVAGLPVAGLPVPDLPEGGRWAAYGWGLLGAFCHASVLVLNRSLRDEPGTARLLLWSSVPGLALAAPLAALDWATPSPADALALVANGVLAGGATLGLAAAFRHAPPSRLAPLEFVALAFAVVADVTIWGVWPSAPVWAGAAVVAFSGAMAQRR